MLVICACVVNTNKDKVTEIFHLFFVIFTVTKLSSITGALQSHMAFALACVIKSMAKRSCNCFCYLP